MSRHTPTPWEAEAKGGKGSWIRGADGEWAALSCGNSDETADANAAFIVRAVNAHEALVAALKTIDLARHTDDPSDWEMATKLSDAALALAEAEP